MHKQKMQSWDRKIYIYPKVTKMESTIGHRIDHKGVGRETPAAHTQQKSTQLPPEGSSLRSL